MSCRVSMWSVLSSLSSSLATALQLDNIFSMCSMNLPRGGGSRWVRNVGCSLKLFQLEVFCWLISFLETTFSMALWIAVKILRKVFQMKIFHFRKKKRKMSYWNKITFWNVWCFIPLFHDRIAVTIHNCDRQWKAMTWLGLIPFVMS